MRHLHRLAAAVAFAAGTLLLGGCTTTLVVAHLVDKLTEGDPTSCFRLGSIERALQPRCGAYHPGSLKAEDVRASGLPVCPLTLAARDPAFWPMLPELVDKGASPEACTSGRQMSASARTNRCHSSSASRPDSDAAPR